MLDESRLPEAAAYVVDVTTDSNFPRAPAAVAAGLHAAVGFLLVSHGDRLGVIEFFSSTIGQLDERLLEALASIGSQVAQALERARLYAAEQALHERFSFLAEAGALLASSLDYRPTLARLAELAVPKLADWCSIDILGEQGIERLAVAHRDPAKRRFARELQERYPPAPEAPFGPAKVLRTGEPEFLPEISDELLLTASAGDAELLAIVRGLGFHSSICVPLIARGRVLGALTLVSADPGRRATVVDLELAEQLARRAATAVDNALLFEAAEQGARAAQALAHVAEAVILLDSAGSVRHWNPGASALTGITEAGALGQQAQALIPDWAEIEQELLVGQEARGATTPLTIPVSLRGEQRWLAVSRVGFAEGSVFALRDVSDERALEQARSDLIATASHELRTPVTAVYGAARTLLRQDIELSEQQRLTFLQVIESEGERLARIVNQILLAGQLDEGDLRLAPEACDLADVAAGVIETATCGRPEHSRIRLRASKALPPVHCDEERFRQVLGNLLENAIKYSPDGGTIEVRLRARKDSTVLLDVADHGIGIPASRQESIFDKFHRLDPALNRGVGGTGLGLYITRQLVTRMGGRISVRSQPGKGATFSVELPTGT